MNKLFVVVSLLLFLILFSISCGTQKPKHQAGLGEQPALEVEKQDSSMSNIPKDISDENYIAFIQLFQ